MPDFRIVAVYQVSAEDEADVVRKWTALSQGDRALTGWLNKVEPLDIEEAGQ